MNIYTFIGVLLVGIVFNSLLIMLSFTGMTLIEAIFVTLTLLAGGGKLLMQMMIDRSG
jgi:hypothetical protein